MWNEETRIEIKDRVIGVHVWVIFGCEVSYVPPCKLPYCDGREHWLNIDGEIEKGNIIVITLVASKYVKLIQ